MQISQPRNGLVLGALAVSGNGRPELEGHDARPAADVYMGSGCHPDIVERLWDQLGAALPSDCRHLVYGRPCLVDPAGLILAVGMGTQYGLRILASDFEAAKAAGAKTIVTWNNGGGMDIREHYGHDWIFGRWLEPEEGWCKAAYGSTDSSPNSYAGASSAKKTEHDFAAIAESERQQHQAKLEQRVAMGEHEAEFELSQVLLNASMKQRSPALLERAGMLLQKAAAGGNVQAVALSQAWPILKREAQRHFPKTGEA